MLSIIFNRHISTYIYLAGLKQTYKNIITVLTKRERQRFLFLMGCSLLVSIADIASIALLFITINLYTPKSAQPFLPLFPQFKLEDYYLLPAVVILLIFLLKVIIFFLDSLHNSLHVSAFICWHYIQYTYIIYSFSVKPSYISFAFEISLLIILFS